MYILGSKSRHLQRIVQFRRSSFTTRRGKGVVLLPQLENYSQIPEQTPTFACQTIRAIAQHTLNPPLVLPDFTAVAHFLASKHQGVLESGFFEDQTVL
jgi:hypothetical protein